MSNNRDNYWDENEDEDDDVTVASFDSDTDLVKKLRKALKVEQRRNKELESSLGELNTEKQKVIRTIRYFLDNTILKKD